MRKRLAASLVLAGFIGVPTAQENAIEPASIVRPQAPPPTLAEVTAVVKQAFRAAYSLDENEALTLARRGVAMGPEEPSAHRALASILWLDILFKRGAVVSDQYLSGSLKEQV